MAESLVFFVLFQDLGLHPVILSSQEDLLANLVAF